jgi:hypothetical protein
MNAEDLVSELEVSTSRLIAALLAGDHQFLEYFERRRSALQQIQRLPPGTMPSSLLPRLQAAWRGGQIAEARVQCERNEMQRRLSEFGRQGRGG